MMGQGGALTSGGITKAVVQREPLARRETGVDMLQLGSH